MSVSNPLLKELKGWTRKLTECGIEINDENLDLPCFCKCLERCLQKGVLMRLNSIGFPKLPDAWYWIEEITDKNLSSCYIFTSAVEHAKLSEKVHTPTGKLRLLIRMCLTRKCLHTPVELLVRTSSMATDFYDSDSILGDDILGEILLSVLLQCSKLNFKLNLRNATFLDETWQIPECMALELVPCKSLGISVCFTKGKALIVNVEQHSVAAEDDKVQPGDVLDEINGNAITSSTKGKLRKIMRKAAGQPISLHIIKLRYKQTNDLYGPIAHLIKNSGIEYMKKLLKSPLVENDKIKEAELIKSALPTKSYNAGFSVQYCGSIYVGTQGDVKQIEGAISNLLQSGEPKFEPVKFECLEIGIRVTHELDDAVICKQSYMEISSCGRTANIPNYFAFIAGETNCNLATKFDAYIFYHQNEAEVQTILQSLGQGFQRTHFAV